MEPKDEIKEKIDLQELMQEYIELKPAGPHSFKGLCPFHGEKTPSLNVSPDKQVWHCFGCGEGGDCFSFIQKIEGMTFSEALIHLGKKVGVEIRRISSTEGNKKQRMLGMHELAEKFYRKVLHDSSASKHARDYIERRGFAREELDRFGIGHAPDQWDALSKVLTKRGYSEGEIVEAGLGLRKKSGSGIIDRFRNRIMIPLRDHHGNTVGFTGRVLNKDDMPKYMNSPETPIYSKSRLVFGLDLAKRAAREVGSIIIVEGNLDVVASHKAGVENIVASSGTALTQDQLELLKRYTETMVFAFDTDAAGFKAAKKGMSLARGLGLDLRAIVLPDGVKDPDELVQKDPEAWRALVSGSVPIMEFLIAHVTRGKDLKNIDDKRAIAKELLPAISEMQEVVQREHWLQHVSDLLAVDVGILRKSVQPAKTTAKPLKTEEKKAISEKASKQERVFELLFGYLLLHDNKEVRERTRQHIPSSDLWIMLYKMLDAEYDSASHSAQKTIFSRLRESAEADQHSEDLLALLDKTILLAEQTFQDMPPTKVLTQLDTLFATLERGADKQMRAELARQLRQAEAAGDTEAVKRLLEKLS